jgi:hypothetical protein
MTNPYCRKVCRSVYGITLLLFGGMALLTGGGADAQPLILHVNASSGNDSGSGAAEKPLRTLSAALARLPDPLTKSATIELAGATHATTGGVEMPPERLELMRRMRPGVVVRIRGRRSEGGAAPVLAWEGGECMVDVREGDWWLESVQIGSGSTRQRRGVQVTGPGHITLKEMTFRTRSQTDAALYAHRGGRVSLRGAIRINESFHDAVPIGDSFSGIIATDHGSVIFAEREGASLELGNGSLSASYYGVIELGCQTARITSWNEQSNCLAINNSGRIDLHSTPTRLCAKQKRNTPIGLEHDGHILAEGARITIESSNDHAIVLQKASTLMCNDIELKGAYRWTVTATTGSVFLGGFLGAVGGIEADTGAHVTVERAGGKLSGPFEVRRCATIALPGRNIIAK